LHPKDAWDKMTLQSNSDYLGVIILESLTDQDILLDVTILEESEVEAPPGDPYPIWSRCLVHVPAEEMEAFASRLSTHMKEDFYNHFVDDQDALVVVFKGRFFVLDKRDKSSWGEMIQYGETVRVGSLWTMNIPVDELL
jgi:hypothetical protein